MGSLAFDERRSHAGGDGVHGNKANIGYRSGFFSGYRELTVIGNGVGQGGSSMRRMVSRIVGTSTSGSTVKGTDGGAV